MAILEQNTNDYREYADRCLGRLQKKQERFRKKYNIDAYDNWHYTQSIDLLELSDPGGTLYFKYIPVGTFSRKSNTWMWSWENDHSISQGKFKTLKIKEFGEEKGFERLTQGIVSGDSYMAWEMTAIAFDQMGGIGAYRVESVDLEIYFLITKAVKPEEAEAWKADLVDCDIHGRARKAFVCKHLVGNDPVGFHEAFETHRGMELGQEDDLQAWCDKCEAKRLETNGWNDESMKFAKIKLVCEGCYFDLKDASES